jgi:hypothetical protein
LIHIVTFRDPLAFPRAGYIQVFYYLHWSLYTLCFGIFHVSQIWSDIYCYI